MRRCQQRRTSQGSVTLRVAQLKPDTRRAGKAQALTFLTHHHHILFPRQHAERFHVGVKLLPLPSHRSRRLARSRQRKQQHGCTKTHQPNGSHALRTGEQHQPHFEYGDSDTDQIRFVARSTLPGSQLQLNQSFQHQQHPPRPGSPVGVCLSTRL